MTQVNSSAGAVELFEDVVFGAEDVGVETGEGEGEGGEAENEEDDEGEDEEEEVEEKEVRNIRGAGQKSSALAVETKRP